MILNSPTLFNSKIADHYAEYRPALHLDILAYFFRDFAAFTKGLDIGCGVGHSSIALSNFCVEVEAIDRSADMLTHTIEQEEIHYQLCDAPSTPFEDRIFDVVTMGGSLPYIKSQTLLDEVIRVSKRRSRILVYDFLIDMSDIYDMLGLQVNSDYYQHDINFAGLHAEPYSLQDELNDEVTIKVNSQNIVHLLHSSNNSSAAIDSHFGSSDALLDKMNNIVNPLVELKVKRYAALYGYL